VIVVDEDHKHPFLDRRSPMLINFACPKCSWKSTAILGKHPADPNYTDQEMKLAWKHVREEHARKCSGQIVAVA
jgi:hypothetical protein